MYVYITMKVIASVEKYENAGMKFSTVPAFALAESRASDACCLFLEVQNTRAKSACFPPWVVLLCCGRVSVVCSLPWCNGHGHEKV